MRTSALTVAQKDGGVHPIIQSEAASRLGLILALKVCFFLESSQAALGRGCVKTQKHEIFVGRVTITAIEKIA